MSEQDWKGRLDSSRQAAQARMEALAEGARDVASSARGRLEATYAQAREQVSGLSADGREIGSRISSRGRTIADRAIFESRGLIADRPLVAVAAGVVAGALLGFLANQLVRQRKIHETDPNSDFDD